MYRHTVFNRCLESELAFPELPPSASTSPSWTLRLGAEPEGTPVGELVGEGTQSHCRVALFRRSAGFAIHHSCTGTFHISRCGTRILWDRVAGTPVEVGRADVLGRVLAVAMHAMGYVSLHASAVAIDGRAVAFLAPKGFGKSTLAVALAMSGGRLITDDSLPVFPHTRPMVAEGIRHARLCTDSAEFLLARRGYPAAGADDKHRIGSLSDAQLWTGDAPLAVLYLLSSREPTGSRTVVSRHQLPTRLSVIAVAQQTKIGALLGKAEAGTVLDRVVSVVRATPVYELHIRRDYSCLHDVADQLGTWQVDAGVAPTETVS